ncbi:MAG: hypothetical protein U5M23_08575 [Marinagarivorans sp.]|nr:hypothetical protein [Marinagarivorans sp.]
MIKPIRRAGACHEFRSTCHPDVCDSEQVGFKIIGFGKPFGHLLFDIAGAIFAAFSVVAEKAAKEVPTTAR